MNSVHWAWWVVSFTYVVGAVIFGWVDRKDTSREAIIARVCCFLASPATVYLACLMLLDDWLKRRKGEKKFGRLE